MDALIYLIIYRFDSAAWFVHEYRSVYPSCSPTFSPTSHHMPAVRAFLTFALLACAAQAAVLGVCRIRLRIRIRLGARVCALHRALGHSGK